jgi:hypothetical protein
MNFPISRAYLRLQPSTYGARFPDSVVWFAQPAHTHHLFTIDIWVGNYVANMAHETFHNLQFARVFIFGKESLRGERSVHRIILLR